MRRPIECHRCVLLLARLPSSLIAAVAAPTQQAIKHRAAHENLTGPIMLSIGARQTGQGSAARGASSAFALRVRTGAPALHSARFMSSPQQPSHMKRCMHGTKSMSRGAFSHTLQEPASSSAATARVVAASAFATAATASSSRSRLTPTMAAACAAALRALRSASRESRSKAPARASAACARCVIAASCAVSAAVVALTSAARASPLSSSSAVKSTTSGDGTAATMACDDVTAAALGGAPSVTAAAAVRGGAARGCSFCNSAERCRAAAMQP